jgi:hypothetical protein
MLRNNCCVWCSACDNNFLSWSVTRGNRLKQQGSLVTCGRFTDLQVSNCRQMTAYGLSRMVSGFFMPEMIRRLSARMHFQFCSAQVHPPSSSIKNGLSSNIWCFAHAHHAACTA